eukprot:7377209-Prymnesium_polylepis.2
MAQLVHVEAPFVVAAGAHGRTAARRAVRPHDLEMEGRGHVEAEQDQSKERLHHGVVGLVSSSRAAITAITSNSERSKSGVLLLLLFANERRSPRWLPEMKVMNLRESLSRRVSERTRAIS